jgi:hypothetical protein
VLPYSLTYYKAMSLLGGLLAGLFFATRLTLYKILIIKKGVRHLDTAITFIFFCGLSCVATGTATAIIEREAFTSFT